MKSCLYDCTPSDLTIGFSHALQTNSNTRLLPDIISQAMKCLKRVFFPTMAPFIVKHLLLPLCPVTNKQMNVLLLIANNLQSPAGTTLFYTKSRNLLDVLLVLLLVSPC